MTTSSSLFSGRKYYWENQIDMTDAFNVTIETINRMDNKYSLFKI